MGRTRSRDADLRYVYYWPLADTRVAPADVR